MIRILAVADSESYLKWAASTLDQIVADGVDAATDVVVIRGPLRPSVRQERSALAGTSTEAPAVLSRRELARWVRLHSPDVVLVAATGPVTEMIALTVLRAAGLRRPALVSGAPGMAYAPTATVGLKWRARWCDAFIAHSAREVEQFSAEFSRLGAATKVVLARLPFLQRQVPRWHGDAHAAVRQIIFAPQSIVPHRRDERLHILRELANLACQGFDVVVKQRTSSGEVQTHHEALPYDQLWSELHSELGLPVEKLRFAAGPISDWLRPGAALLTVSSTAALEGMAAGVPTALIADFGVRPDLVNEAFEGSGCLVELRDLPAVLSAGGPVPHDVWLSGNYLHDSRGHLGATVRDLATARAHSALPDRHGVRPDSWLIWLYSAIKSDVPWVWLPAKMVRTVLGRWFQIR